MIPTKSFSLLSALGITVATGLFTAAAPAVAQGAVAAGQCVALKVVEGGGSTLVRKSIKKGAFGPGNLNTDFAIPTGLRFDYYVLEFLPENNEHYDGSVTMKNADGSSSTAYSGSGNLTRGKTYYMPFRSPTLTQPYQLNLWVGSGENNSYQARIWACRDKK